MYEDDIEFGELKKGLLSESISEGERKQINFEDGNVHNGITDVWVTEKEEEDKHQLEGDGVEYVLKQQWRRYLNALSIFWFKCQDD